MKKFSKLMIALLLSVLLFIPSAIAVFYYTRPMKDASYDLSLITMDGQEWEGDKGWTVYTNEAGKVTELTPDGTGGYLGLDYPGQTFYFSRQLTEELDGPTLQVGTSIYSVCVFLNDTLIYTDCPELDNRIGYLQLPMLEYDRTDAVTVSLPPDYLGQTLTIAQSSSAYSEKQEPDETVYPCRITLYCGYAYESSLIASAAKFMLPVAMLFALELLLLAAFIRKASVGDFSLHLPVFALALLFQICSLLSHADFFYIYFGSPSYDSGALFFELSLGTLLLLLALYAERLCPLYLVCAALQWSIAILSFVTQATEFLEYGQLYIFLMYLPQYVSFFSLATALIGALILWKRGKRFFRHLLQTALLLTIGYALFLVICLPFSPDYTVSVFTRLWTELTGNPPKFSLILIWNLCLISSLTSIALELFEQEMERRTELAVLSAKNKLAIESYENLRRQSEEVMMLRHDTQKHYSLLRTMAEESPERLTCYLDELIGQVENIRPVVNSQNQVLNIMINGKLNAAATKGISAEIVRSEAPQELPLTDAELCCLVINILDNAINAASSSEIERPYIKLDFHCKDQYFVFSCENSMQGAKSKNRKPFSPEHGYGLKIIRQIMKRWGEHMISIEETDNTYQITVVIPLMEGGQR